jgi:hypothetical protein
MGLFGKKKQRYTCPICGADLEGGGLDNVPHWKSHVQQIPPGYGDASGQYTWECVCGPAGLKWPREFGAAAGLGEHMEQRHGIPLLDN